jgi:hypothetical protein
MSWETLVVGYVAFKPFISMEGRREIVVKIKQELELPSKNSVLNCPYLERYEKDGEDSDENDFDTFDFQHVNWSSHVSEDTIKNLLEKIKYALDSYSFDLYYLDEPYAYFSSEQDEDEDDEEAI